jgi:hypothetical protein
MGEKMRLIIDGGIISDCSMHGTTIILTISTSVVHLTIYDYALDHIRLGEIKLFLGCTRDLVRANRAKHSLRVRTPN